MEVHYNSRSYSPADIYNQLCKSRFIAKKGWVNITDQIAKNAMLPSGKYYVIRHHVMESHFIHIWRLHQIEQQIVLSCTSIEYPSMLLYKKYIWTFPVSYLNLANLTKYQMEQMAL